MGPHTFQPSNANDNRKKWFTNPKSAANCYKVKCLVYTQEIFIYFKNYTILRYSDYVTMVIKYKVINNNFNIFKKLGKSGG